MSSLQPLSEIHQARPGYQHHELNAVPVIVDAETLARPLGVTVVASFQFFKAAILLLAGVLLRISPEMASDPKSLIYPLLFIATRGKFASMHESTAGSNLLPTLLTILGVYLAVVGFGMWRVRKWARKSTLMNSGITLLLFAQATLMAAPTAAGDPASPDLNYMHVLLAIDALIFIYLMRGNTLELFEAVDWRREHGS